MDNSKKEIAEERESSTFNADVSNSLDFLIEKTSIFLSNIIEPSLKLYKKNKSSIRKIKHLNKQENKGQAAEELYDLINSILWNNSIFNNYFYEFKFEAWSENYHSVRLFAQAEKMVNGFWVEMIAEKEIDPILGMPFRLKNETGLYLAVIDRKVSLVGIENLNASTRWHKRETSPDQYCLVNDGYFLSTRINNEEWEIYVIDERFNISATSNRFLKRTICSLQSNNMVLALSPMLSDLLYAFPEILKKVESGSEQQIVPLEYVQNTSPLSSGLKISAKRDVTKFTYNIVEKLLPAKGQSLVLCIGNVGAGKSAFINYMLGHKFKKNSMQLDSSESDDGWGNEDSDSDDNFNIPEKTKGLMKNNLSVEDETKPFSVMGGSVRSVTRYPSTYQAKDEDFSYCDCPGFATGNLGEDSFNNFNMMITKDLAKKIKVIVVVIEIAQLYSSRGSAWISLINTLKSIFHFESDSERDNFKRNVVFVFNSKGQTEIFGERIGRSNILKRIEEFRENLINDEAYKFYENYKKLLSEEDDKERFKTRFNQIIKRIGGNFVGKTSSSIDGESLKSLEESARKTEQLLFITEMVRPKNSIVWGNNLNEPKVRNLISKRVRTLESFIPKENLRFEFSSVGNQKFLINLVSWVEGVYGEPLAKIANNKKRLEKRMKDIKISLQESVEERKSYFRKEIKNYYKEILLCLKKIESLSEEVLFQDLFINRREFNLSDYFKPGSWWPQTKTKPYQLSASFVKVQKIAEEQLKGCRFKELNLELESLVVDTQEKKPKKVNNALMLNALKKEEVDRSIIQRVGELEIEDIIQEIESLNSPGTEDDGGEKFFNCSLTYQGKKWNGVIEEQKVAGVIGLRRDHPAHLGEYEWLLSHVEKLKEKILIIVKEFEKLELSDDLLTKRNVTLLKEIQAIERGISLHEKEIQGAQSYFSNGYQYLILIKNILDGVSQSNLHDQASRSPRHIFEYGRITEFLALCEIHYPVKKEILFTDSPFWQSSKAEYSAKSQRTIHQINACSASDKDVKEEQAPIDEALCARDSETKGVKI